MSENEVTYLVWSNEQAAWWAATSGYTVRLSEARHFSRAEAIGTCAATVHGDAHRFGMPPELPVCYEDMLLMIKASGTYPAELR